MTGTLVVPILILVYIISCSIDVTDGATTSKPVITELADDKLILLNLAAKGRIVELLANELARTEIIRALLVEYAKECVDNVTALEKNCLNCMMDRCTNRFSECNIPVPQLQEVIVHDPSPIQGLQFLSKSPDSVDESMRTFVSRARDDILRDIPESLRSEGETIVHTEIDESMKDLNNNINTEKALQTVQVHVQKAKKKMHLLPEIGEKVGNFIVDNEENVNNIAETLAEKLKEARPVIVTIQETGASVMDNMPSAIQKFGQKVSVFKDKVVDVFQSALGVFRGAFNDGETPVMQGPPPGQNMQVMQNMNVQGLRFSVPQDGQFHVVSDRDLPVGPDIPQGQLWAEEGMPNQGDQFQMRGRVGQFGTSGMQGQMMLQGGQFQGNGQMVQGVQQGNQIHRSGIQQGALGSQFLGAHIQNGQFQQGNQVPVGMTPGSQNNQFPGHTEPNMQGAQFQGGQILPLDQGQLTGHRGSHKSGAMPVLTGRKRRQIDPNCKDLERDPDTFCRKYETQCHNCTLEKQLRFEVCGEGVEKARDEIKRMDMSVQGYLDAYDNHIAQNPVLLKVEISSDNRLHKSNSYYDAYVTAKIGPSIIRYRNKAVINLNDVRVSGSGIGDGIWEKLWENQIFKEAKSATLNPDKAHEMGQTHIVQIGHESHAHQKSGSSHLATSSLLSVLFSFVSCILIIF